MYKLVNVNFYICFEVPENFAPPTLISLTPTSVEVKWTEAQDPNGLIYQYEVERLDQNSLNPVVIGTVLPSSALIIIDDAAVLSPFTKYQYRVKVMNGAGATASDWSEITTMSASKAFQCLINFSYFTELNVKQVK